MKPRDHAIGALHATATAAPVIAYIVNQYPKVSHSFVRREIHALERAGETVHRYAMRGWDADLVDPLDLAERDRTTYLLQGGALPLALAFVGMALRRPGGTFKALGQTARMVRRSDRSVARHIITLFEACLLGQKAARAGITHIHAHFGTNSAEVAMLTALLTGIAYSFTVHGPDEFDRPEFIRLRDKMRHAKFVAAISAYCTSQLYRWADFDDWAKIKTVRCGIAGSYDDVAQTAEPVANRLVCVGRLSGQKGHLLLIEAAARLHRQGHIFDLVLVGDGELRGEIETRIRAAGLEDRVHITGWASEDRVRLEILESRGLILTSFAEGLPVVIMEAMALRRVVLATTIAAIPELVQPGKTGWLFAAGSAEAAADAIRECLTASPEICRTMGDRARERVTRRHDVDREAAYLARLIRSDPGQLAEREAS